jgi:hypothetical protein
MIYFFYRLEFRVGIYFVIINVAEKMANGYLSKGKIRSSLKNNPLLPLPSAPNL